MMKRPFIWNLRDPAFYDEQGKEIKEEEYPSLQEDIDMDKYYDKKYRKGEEKNV